MSNHNLAFIIILISLIAAFGSSIINSYIEYKAEVKSYEKLKQYEQEDIKRFEQALEKIKKEAKNEL